VTEDEFRADLLAAGASRAETHATGLREAFVSEVLDRLLEAGESPEAEICAERLEGQRGRRLEIDAFSFDDAADTLIGGKGSDAFVIPAAWPMSRIEQWGLLGRARAVENQCFVIQANTAVTLSTSNIDAQIRRDLCPSLEMLDQTLAHIVRRQRCLQLGTPLGRICGQREHHSVVRERRPVGSERDGGVNLSRHASEDLGGRQGSVATQLSVHETVDDGIELARVVKRFLENVLHRSPVLSGIRNRESGQP